MPRRRLARALFVLPLLILAAPIVGGAPSAGAAPAGPAGFSDSLVLSVPSPTGIAWTPDGRMLLTQDTGQVRVVRNGVLATTPALALGTRLCSSGARGLAGIVVDPSFATNRFVYLHWSHNRFNFRLAPQAGGGYRVSRFIYAGEHAPSVTLNTPVVRYGVGEVVPMSGTATDAEDGALPASSLTWTVLLNHDTHQHPYFGPVSGASISPTYPRPEDVAAADTSFIIVSLVARDSRGLTTTIQRSIYPRKVALTFATAPAGGMVVVNGISYATPRTLTSWDKWVLPISAPNQTIVGVPRTFVSWSDGGAQSHNIVSPVSKMTYTATFG